jgi:hypothetical protein
MRLQSPDARTGRASRVNGCADLAEHDNQTTAHAPPESPIHVAPRGAAGHPGRLDGTLTIGEAALLRASPRGLGCSTTRAFTFLQCAIYIVAGVHVIDDADRSVRADFVSFARSLAGIDTHFPCPWKQAALEAAAIEMMGRVPTAKR